MAARHDEDATGGGTTPPKGDGQIAGPEDPSQLSQNNGSIEGGGNARSAAWGERLLPARRQQQHQLVMFCIITNCTPSPG